MREERANTKLRFRWSEIVFRPSILLVNSVVRLDGDGGKRVQVSGDLIPYSKIVSRVHK